LLQSISESTQYAAIAVLLILVTGLAVVILLLSWLVGPKRVGATKFSTYESGVDPIGDSRRRFNVRFYLIAVLFLVFDVEIIFLYPWAVLFPRVRDGVAEYNQAEAGGALADVSANAAWAHDLASQGYDPAFFIVSIGIFFALLTVGFVYEWRKGIFKWD